MDEQQPSMDVFRFVVEGVVLTVISSLGILGTTMSIYVLLKPRLRDCFSTFLTGLAVCDSVFLFFAILMFGLPMLWTWYGTKVLVHLIPFSHGALHVARMGSVYITMSVTLERYFAVVHPLRNFWAKKFLLPGTALFAVLYNLPKFFEMETYTWPFNNETDIRQTAMRQDPLYESLYTFWSKIIFMEAIPYLTIIVLNAFIIWKIAKSSKFRRNFRQRGGNSGAAAAATARPPSSSGGGGGGGTIQTQHSYETQTSLLQHQQQQCDTRSGHRASVKSSSSMLSPNGNSSNSSSGKKLTAAQRRKQCFMESRFNTIDSAVSERSEGLRSSSSSHIMIRPRSYSDLRVQQQQQQQQQQQEAASMPRKQEVNLAVTLVSISLLFIVCQSVKIITDAYEELFCEKVNLGGKLVCESNTLLDYAICLSNLSTCINSSANFLVYMLRGKKFRDLFLETYCCRKSRYGAAGNSHRSRHEASAIGNRGRPENFVKVEKLSISLSPSAAEGLSGGGVNRRQQQQKKRQFVAQNSQLFSSFSIEETPSSSRSSSLVMKATKWKRGESYRQQQQHQLSQQQQQQKDEETKSEV